MIKPKIKHYNELISTNTYTLENFDTLKTGDIISAEVQTSGRGRLNREWDGSSSGNIYMSFVIKPINTDEFPFVNLTQYLSVVVNRILERNYRVKSNIKWPNDILYNGKKLCGILAEAKTKKNKIEGMVLGIGINVNGGAVNVPNAISLKTILKKELDRDKLQKEISNEFFKDFEKFEAEGFSTIMEEYVEMCKFNNGNVKISGSFMDGEYELVEINKDGTLSVLDKEKKIHNVISGDLIC